MPRLKNAPRTPKLSSSFGLPHVPEESTREALRDFLSRCENMADCARRLGTTTHQNIAYILDGVAGKVSFESEQEVRRGLNQYGYNLPVLVAHRVLRRESPFPFRIVSIGTKRHRWRDYPTAELARLIRERQEYFP